MKSQQIKIERLCEIGFWLSIIGTILIILGILDYIIIIYAFILYTGIKGLKTSKKNKAIISIFLSFIAIIITFAWLFKIV